LPDSAACGLAFAWRHANAKPQAAKRTLLDRGNAVSNPEANPVLAESVQFLKGVGPGRADLLAKLEIRTIGDLLFHFPRSYDDLTNVQPMDKIEAGVLQTVQGEVVEIDGKELPDGRQITSVVIADAQGKCVAGIWFNSLMIVGKVHYGQKVAFSGKPKWYRDHWTMNHPRVQVL